MSLTLIAALASCGTSDPEANDSSRSAPSGATGSPDAETEERLAQAFPPFPPIIIPDVTSLTGAADRFATPLAELATPSSGVSVLGARCDSAGKIVNRGSLTEINNGDGSGSYTDGALTVKNVGDGSGTFQDGALTIAVNPDGSGTITDGALTVAIAKDGSGTYQDGALVITLDGKGAGTLQDGARTITVNGDGSGVYQDGWLNVINNGNGTGTHHDGALTVENLGNGTASFQDGADPGTVPMVPLAPVPALGKFPPVKKLTPVGKACGTLIRLNDDVLFDFGKATLRPAAEPTLEEIAQTLLGSSSSLRIDGHTDAIGEDAYNRGLSGRRAQAVKAALRGHGVTTPMTATGYGESRPLAPNSRGGKDYPTGRQLNRRVEIMIPA